MPANPSLTDREVQQSRRHFRADIQALRAIAVILVLIYHLRPNRMPGGYIGVDVFFVISGFLITSHLIRDTARTGRVTLGAFWAARARRILPASLVTIAVTIGLTAWLAPVTLFDDLRNQALASIFYVQNWVLAADAVDYSAADNDATAFQHFWSLSVEEQFYLFWPLLVFAGLWIVTRRAANTAHRSSNPPERQLRRVLLVIFLTVVLASLAYSIDAVSDGRQNAYFVTTTRVWELGAGGLLAVIGVRRLGRGWRYALNYLGLTAILASALLLTNETPFPGLAALPVILGTVAVILAGIPDRDEDERSLVRYDPWTFGSRLGVVQWIGDRSYSLYLWHFPVIILWTMVVDHSLGYRDVLGMIALSVVLAHLSYQLVEQPVRRSRYFTDSARRSLLGGLVAMLMVAALTFAYPLLSGRAASGDWDDLDRYARSLSNLGAAAVTDDDIPAFTTEIAAMTPTPLDAKRDRNLVFDHDECVADSTSEDPTPACVVGADDASLSVVLVGDSHARMYSTALAQMAQDNNWQLRTYLRNACPFNPVPRESEAAGDHVCARPNEAVMDAILADPPDLVITTWLNNATYVGRGAAGFAEYWNTLEDAGSKVLVLRDVPRLDKHAPDCVAENYDDPDVCATPRGRALRGNKLLTRAVAKAPGVAVADFTDLFCTEEVCKPVIGNVLVYKDKHHITDTFAVSMIPWLDDAINNALAATS